MVGRGRAVEGAIAVANLTMLRGLLATCLICASGCSSFRAPQLPQISAEQFTLDLEADWDAVGRGVATEIVHRLSNESAVAVCVGGSWKLQIAGEGVLVITTMDVLCPRPLIVVEPGGQAEWASTVQLGQCLEESDPRIPALMRLRCGVELKLDVEIAVFRWNGKAPEWGATHVLSDAVGVTRLNTGPVSEALKRDGP